MQYDWQSPSEYKQYSVPRPQPPAPALHSYRPLPRRPRHAFERPQPDTAVLRRRHVYQHKLYSFHVGSNPLSGYREVTPAMIASSPELQSRARAWIRRELRVFTFLHTEPENGPLNGATTSSNAEFLLSYIVAIMKKVDLKAGDGHAENLLTDFLGRENARLFLHELSAWMRSPFAKIAEWDREAQYAQRLPEQVLSLGMGACS